MSHVRVRVGLLEPKHVAAMGGGSPLTLYLWLHTRVRFKGDGAGTTFPQQPYRHQDAADALGVPYGTVRRWLRALLRGGYVTTRSLELSNGLELSITKYECTPVQKRTPLTDEGRPKMDRGVSTDGQGGVQKWPPPTVARATQENTREVHTPLQGAAPPAPAGHPAVTAYRKGARANPLPAVRAQIEAAVPADDPAALERWAGAVGAWVGEGYNPRNVAGMLEWFRDGVPSRKQRGSNGRLAGGPRSASSRIDAVIERATSGRRDADAERGRADAGLGHQEAGRGVPRLLP